MWIAHCSNTNVQCVWSIRLYGQLVQLWHNHKNTNKMNVVWLVKFKYIFICLQSKVEAFAFWSQNKTLLKPKHPPHCAFWSLPIQAKLSVFLISTKFFIVEDNRYNLRSWWSWIENLQINIIYFHESVKIKANEKISEIYETFLEWRQEDTVSRDNSQSTSWISNFHCDLPCRHQNGETWLYVTFPL